MAEVTSGAFPDQSACWLETFRAGALTAVEGDLDTLMAGLACGEMSALAWEILKGHADVAIAMTDAVAVQVVRDLADAGNETPIVAGESAVVGPVGLRAAEWLQFIGIQMGFRRKRSSQVTWILLWVVPIKK